MIRTAVLAALALAALASMADAHARRPAVCVPTGDVMRPCAPPDDFLAAVRSMDVFPPVMTREQIGRPRARRHWTSRKLPVYKAPDGIVAPLAAKVAEIEAACAARVISTVRHTYIAGTRRMSLHASGKAVDMAGDARCIYARLAGWQGGYSVDYRRVRHVHISWDAEGGREWGLRFAHGGFTRHHHRAARRHHRHRFAGAGGDRLLPYATFLVGARTQ